MRVMVYESSKDRAKLIQDLLVSYRYKVYMNYKNSSSIDEVRDVKPSLIIMNGNRRSHIEFLEQIKQDSKYSHIPVILISNLNSTEVADRISELPNVDYLVEPFKIKNFRHIVERWITFRSLYVN